ncbi:hypothetical protein ABW20_dc0110460 [Dactylellina cionopaga]|nr:hypothetical protein ABW20_dc0110460 [Dactylellina cionopaga]
MSPVQTRASARSQPAKEEENESPFNPPESTTPSTGAGSAPQTKKKKIKGLHGIKPKLTTESSSRTPSPAPEEPKDAPLLAPLPAAPPPPPLQSATQDTSVAEFVPTQTSADLSHASDLTATEPPILTGAVIPQQEATTPLAMRANMLYETALRQFTTIDPNIPPTKEPVPSEIPIFYPRPRFGSPVMSAGQKAAVQRQNSMYPAPITPELYRGATNTPNLPRPASPIKDPMNDEFWGQPSETEKANPDVFMGYMGKEYPDSWFKVESWDECLDYKKKSDEEKIREGKSWEKEYEEIIGWGSDDEPEPEGKV